MSEIERSILSLEQSIEKAKRGREESRARVFDMKRALLNDNINGATRLDYEEAIFAEMELYKEWDELIENCRKDIERIQSTGIARPELASAETDGEVIVGVLGFCALILMFFVIISIY